MKVEDNKQIFKSLCERWIKREGISDLLNWLDSTDFYTAPASTKFHSMYEGGLCQHSINVFNRLVAEFKNLDGYKFDDETMESLAIVGLFHDLTKVNFYKETTRNVKNEITGQWEKVPYYAVENNSALSGHGYKSARIVNKFMDISDEEYMAIVMHMGFSTDENTATVSETFQKNKLALLLHIADTKASYIDEAE